MTLTQMIIDRLKAEFNSRGRSVTMKSVAELSGVSRSTVQEMLGLTFAREWPLDKIYAVCRAMRIDICEIIKKFEDEKGES